jgi:hypothetical protein
MGGSIGFALEGRQGTALAVPGKDQEIGFSR